MKQIKLLALFVVLLSTTTNTWAWSGSGTATNPYLIQSEADWNALANGVSDSQWYSGKYFKMTNDITVTTMVGGNRCPWFNNIAEMLVTSTTRFCGIFDGDGHTLTVHYDVEEVGDPDKWAVAPFRVVGDGATFRNLHIAGTIEGQNGFAAGLIGCIQDYRWSLRDPKTPYTITIEHCRSSVKISTAVISAADMVYNGGFIGSTSGWRWLYRYQPDVLQEQYGLKVVNFKDCIFDGQFNGNDKGHAGFIGVKSTNVTVNFDGCAFVPFYISLDDMSTQSTFVGSQEGDTNIPDFSSCYYVNGNDIMGGMLDGMILQGTQVFSISGRDGVTVDFNGYGFLTGCEDFTQIEFYENAGAFKGFKIGDRLFTKGTESVSLNLAGSTIGYKIDPSETVTLIGTDNPYTLQMKSTNCEITPNGLAVATRQDPKNPTDYYTTFYYKNKRFQLTPGVEAYVATLNETNDHLDLTKVAGEGDVLPRDDAFLLKGKSNPIYLKEKIGATGVSYEVVNDFRGAEKDITTVPDNCYVFSAVDGEIGFYQYDHNATLKAHKAYVVLPDDYPSGAPRRLPLIFESAQAIEDVQANNAQSNKYIENGQLFIIKNGVKYNAVGQIVK